MALLLVLTQGCGPRDYFRTEIGASPCLAAPDADCRAANLLLDAQDDYALGFVEFDDEGRFYDRRQAEVLLGWLSDRREPLYVVMYTHGWHHNASDADNNVRRFKDSLRDIKKRNPQYRVVGIYLGWRGEVLNLPWLRALTFSNRKSVSETLGRNHLLDFLLRVENVVKADAGQANRLLTIGHSLGASVIFNALQAVWLQRLTHPEPSGFGDLVVLVNPAFEARRFAALRAAMGQSGQSPALTGLRHPLLVMASSEADAITKKAFTWSRALPAWFEGGDDLRVRTGLEGSSEWELGATAVGHFQRFITHRLEALGPVGAASPARVMRRVTMAGRVEAWLRGPPGQWVGIWHGGSRMACNSGKWVTGRWAIEFGWWRSIDTFCPTTGSWGKGRSGASSNRLYG